MRLKVLSGGRCIAVKGNSGNLDVDVPVAISQFCEEMGDTISIDRFLHVGVYNGVTDSPVCVPYSWLGYKVSAILQTAFGIRGLSRKQITKLTVKEEMHVTSARRIASMPQNLPTSASCESLNLKVSRSFSGPINLQNVGSGLVSSDEV